MAPVLPHYCRSEEEFLALCQRLKLTPCPFCKLIGALIRHGDLYGYGERDENRKSRRGHRIFCNNRKARKNGCGHTFSVWAADKLRRLRLDAATLWTFLELVLELANQAQALRNLNLDLSPSYAYCLWKRFRNAQSHIRTALAKRLAAPKLPKALLAEAQTLAHVKAAFPGAACPIVEFQYQLQTSFL